MKDAPAPSYPVLARILAERLRYGASVTLQNWIGDADRGLERLLAGSNRVAREAILVRRALGLASGLVDHLALAATDPQKPR